MVEPRGGDRAGSSARVRVAPQVDALPTASMSSARLRATETINVRATPLVRPPVAPAIDVFARILAEVGRADDEDLEALWPGFVASPRCRAGPAPHPIPCARRSLQRTSRLTGLASEKLKDDP